MFCTRKKQKTYIEHESGAHLIPNITKESSFEDIYEVFTACKIFWQLVLLYFNRESNDLICIGNWIISSISSKTAAPSWIKYQSKLHLISVFGTKQKALAISQFLSSQVTYQNRSGVWNVKCCIYLNCLNWLFSKDGIANPCWITIITFENICLHCENQNSYMCSDSVSLQKNIWLGKITQKAGIAITMVFILSPYIKYIDIMETIA